MKGEEFCPIRGRWNREEQAGQTAQVQTEEQGWSWESSLSPGQGTSKEQGKHPQETRFHYLHFSGKKPIYKIHLWLQHELV